MKNILTLCCILAMTILLVSCQSQSGDDGNGYSNSAKGRVVFAMTDAAADMGSVSEVRVTVDSIRVHSNTEGWVTVSQNAKTYDLLELKAEGSEKLLADVEIKEGTYDQMRLDISQVIVVDEDGSHEAKLPSNQLIVKGTLQVEADSTSTAKFDFIADESLHITGNGKYIMAPVVQVETRSDADVKVESNNKVKVTGGRVVSNAKHGMDASGRVDVGLKIPSNAKISIGSGAQNGKIMIDTKGALNIGIGGDEEMDDDDETEARGSVNSSASSRTRVGSGIGADVDTDVQGDLGVRY